MSQFQVNQECFCPDNKYSNSINIPGIAWFGQCHLHRCWRGNFWPDFGSQTEKAWRERSKGLASSGQNKQSSVKYRELSLFFCIKQQGFNVLYGRHQETSTGTPWLLPEIEAYHVHVSIHSKPWAMSWVGLWPKIQGWSHLGRRCASEVDLLWSVLKKHLQRKTTKNDQLIWWRNTSVIIFLALTLFLG